jgi:hypothetical protein
MFRDKANKLFSTYYLLANSINSLKFRIQKIRENITNSVIVNFINPININTNTIFSGKYGEECVMHKIRCRHRDIINLFTDFNTTIKSLSSTFNDLTIIEATLNKTTGLSSAFTAKSDTYANVAQFQTTNNICNEVSLWEAESFEFAYRINAMSRWLIKIKDRLSIRIANIRDSLSFIE